MSKLGPRSYLTVTFATVKARAGPISAKQELTVEYCLSSPFCNSILLKYYSKKQILSMIHWRSLESNTQIWHISAVF